MGRGKKKQAECTYCGKIRRLSEDHVPPKGLWGEPYPLDLIVVPSCKECNDGFSKDDEYFRTIISIAEDVGDHPVVQQVLPIVNRSLTRKDFPGLPKTILRNTEIVYRQGTSGLYEPAALYTMDRPRIERVISRVIQGLFFHRFGRRLAPTYFAWSEMLGMVPTKVPPVFTPLLKAFNNERLEYIGNDGFVYGVLIDSEDPDMTFWILVFYGRCYFIGFTTPKEMKPGDGLEELIRSRFTKGHGLGDLTPNLQHLKTLGL